MDEKQYGIFKVTDAKSSIIQIKAETFSALPGSSLILFKDWSGEPVIMMNLEPGHYIALI